MLQAVVRSEWSASCLDAPTRLPVTGLSVCAMDVRIQAGFPSPAEDHGGKRIDVLEHLVKHPQATFQLQVRGESMREAGIFDGDVVLVDKAIRPRSGQIVVAVVDGDFTIKRLWQRAGRMKLLAANPTFPDITPKDGQEILIWGVVVASITVHRT